MISETIEDVIKDIEEMLIVIDRAEETAFISEERAKGARLAYRNCLVQLNYIVNNKKVV